MGRDEFGLGREIFEASRPWDVKNVKAMANPAVYMILEKQIKMRHVNQQTSAQRMKCI